MKKIAIIGYGFVGKAMAKAFPDALIYDPFLKEKPINFCSDKDRINQCDVAFVCVPTQMLPNGECDTSIVEETVKWLETPLIIIRSTVKPGTTDGLNAVYPSKEIVFQPEYVGETVAHPLLDEGNRNFLIFGGSPKSCRKAVRVYQEIYNANIRILFLSAIEAEIVKYMENTAIGSMVTLCNEFYNICQAFGADYNMVREGFLLDSRMSRYFTFVYPNARGFGGKCLPKDLNAIAAAAGQAGYNPKFIGAILENNDRFNKQNI